MSKKVEFRKTEIGMTPKDWEETTIGDAIEINPKRNLRRGLKTKKVSMQDLREFNKKIQGFVIEEYNAGSKFANKDTLMARITPCLENGKTAFVDILDNDEIGFGSTEFIVLCSREEKTVDEFVYYLAISPKMRADAIQSMTGTSGRQRVQTDLLEIKKILLPPLPEQRIIAKILSDLDSKIELNQQMNKTLEAIGQAIFKHWFVDFEFPNEEGKPYKSSGGEMVDSELGKIPKGWRVESAISLFKLEYGWHLPEWDRAKGKVPVFGSGGLSGYHSEAFVKGPGIILGRAGKIGSDSVYYSYHDFCPLETTFYVSQDNKKLIMYLYFFIKTLSIVNTGSSVPNLSRSSIHGAQIIIPKKSIIELFDDTVTPMFGRIYENQEEIKILSQIRDSLLPKLMSGKIRVPVKVKIDA